MLILDGKIASAAVKATLLAQTQALTTEGKRAPHLAAILVGNNGASETYVASKVKNCEETGFESTLIRLDVAVSEKILLDKIIELNNNPAIDGILVQLPLPKHIDEAKVIETINPAKDVDGFHPANVGRLVQGLPTFIPATPYGILLMLAHFDIPTKGKNAVVIGRSNIVGRPMSILLSSNIPQGNCTVTLCHSHTKNLKEICLEADIIVAALGVPNFLTGDMIKSGAACTKASAITPVPGGVGLMTIAGLLKNTMKAYEASQNK
jgi:methylenetetrahydrofolate dehydrogenase (NADP+)/methenyltetrahydrofolate cyclohydrolase